MLELLESRGLIDIKREDLVPQPVLEAAERKSANFSYFSPLSGVPYMQRKLRRTVKELKTLSESVLPSRAIRLIRQNVSSLEYGVQLKKADRRNKQLRDELSGTIDSVLSVLDNPNTTDDDLPTFIAQIVEDLLCFDAGAWEYVPKPKFVNNNNVLALETVPGYTLATRLDWSGDPNEPRWMQLLENGRAGAQFLDREIEYLSMRKRSWTPFGVSPLEVVCDIMDSWLGITSYQRRVASEAYPPIMLVMKGMDQSQLNVVKSWWDNEIKGRATPGFIGWPSDVDSIDMKPGGDNMLMLAYQEMLVRTISFAFDLKPLDFSIERDVNRTTAEVQRISSLREGPKSIARVIAAKFNQRVLPMLAKLKNDPNILKLEFFWLNIDPADDKAQAEAFQIYSNSEVMLPDEIRAELDLEPRADGLGMLSVNALKELYTIDPLASQQSKGGKGKLQLPEPPAPNTNNNLDQIKQ